MDQRQAILDLNDQIAKAMRADEETYVDAVTSYYDQFLGKIQADLMALYSRVFRGGELNWVDYKRLKMEDQTMRMIQPSLNELQQQTANELNDSLNNFYWDAYKRNAWMLDETTPPNVDISMVRDKKANPAQDPLLANLISQQVLVPFKGAMFSDRLGHINTTMAQQIGIMTRQAAINGWSVPDLSSGIRDLVGVPLDEKLVTRPRASAAKSRADMIARTELQRAMNAARAQLFDENDDIVNDQKWLAADDFRTCDACLEFDGHTQEEIDEMGYDEYEDSPPAHPRCRCTWIPVLKSWKELLGPDLGKGMEDLESVDEYEMKYFNADKTGLANIKVQPYEKWLVA